MGIIGKVVGGSFLNRVNIRVSGGGGFSEARIGDCVVTNYPIIMIGKEELNIRVEIKLFIQGPVVLDIEDHFTLTTSAKQMVQISSKIGLP
jgi:hypothetical protein